MPADRDYLEIITGALRVCADYRPRFGPDASRTWLLGKVVKNQVLLGGSEGARLWLPVVGE